MGNDPEKIRKEKEERRTNSRTDCKEIQDEEVSYYRLIFLSEHLHHQMVMD